MSSHSFLDKMVEWNDLELTTFHEHTKISTNC